MDEIAKLADSYKDHYQWKGGEVRSRFNELYVKYVTQRKQDIVDSVAVGIVLESLLSGSDIDIDAMPGNVKEAFHDAFPNLDISTLNDRSPEDVADLVNAWKGKLFEVEVRDQLNAGAQVGDWQLESGQHAELAESSTQPGWDLSIVNDDGSVADVIQLKATDSASYINHALERYPDVPIVTTSDIHTHGVDAISASDLSDHDVTHQVTNAVDAGDSASEHLLHTMPAAVIVATEWYQVAKGKKTFDEALDSGGQRVAISTVAGAVGAAASLVLGPFGWLVGVGTRMWLGSKFKKEQAPVFRQEKLINPPSELPSPERIVARKKATKQEAEDAFKELRCITDRLLLEYKGCKD